MQMEDLQAITAVLKSIGDDWRNSTREYKKTKMSLCLDCLQFSNSKSQTSMQQANIRRTVKSLVQHGKPQLIHKEALVTLKKNFTQKEQEFAAIEKLALG